MLSFPPPLKKLLFHISTDCQCYGDTGTMTCCLGMHYIIYKLYIPYKVIVINSTPLNLFFSNRNVFHGEEDAGGMDPLVLPESSSHDSVLCSTVGDLTWSQRNQLVLGTYGKVGLSMQQQQQQLQLCEHRYLTIMWLLSNNISNSYSS